MFTRQNRRAFEKTKGESTKCVEAFKFFCASEQNRCDIVFRPNCTGRIRQAYPKGLMISFSICAELLPADCFTHQPTCFTHRRVLPTNQPTTDGSRYVLKWCHVSALGGSPHKVLGWVRQELNPSLHTSAVHQNEPFDEYPDHTKRTGNHQGPLKTLKNCLRQSVPLLLMSHAKIRDTDLVILVRRHTF